jgi:KUP system potassium uptake protein
VPSTAVFLTQDKDVAPFALRTTVGASRALAEHVVLLSWRVEDTPAAPAHEADVEIDTFEQRHPGIVGVAISLGYRERLVAAHVLSRALQQAPEAMSGVDPETAVYLVSESLPRLSRGGDLAMWRQRLFLVLDRLATDRVDQLSLPRDRTIVIGREFDL